MSPILAPLDRHKSKLVVLRDIDMKSAMPRPGGNVGMAHERGRAHLLTGREMVAVGGKNAVASGPSVDQTIAERVCTGLPFKSLHFGASAAGTISHAGRARPLFPENEPARAFASIFANVGRGTVAEASRLAALRLRRRSAFDLIRGELSRIDAQLVGADRERYRAHLAALREVETRMGALERATCQAPAKPPRHASSKLSAAQVLDLQAALLVRALACDLTRVVTLQFGKGARSYYPWLKIAEDHHVCAHRWKQASYAAKIQKIETWHTTRLAKLLDALKAVREDSGTLLDNCLVLRGSNLAQGSHTWTSMPFILAGDAGGKLKTGRYLSYDHVPHNGLLVALCRIMGLSDVESFGDERYGSGPLKGLA